MTRPRFTLRSLVVLVAFAALVLAVVLLGVENARLQREALRVRKLAEANQAVLRAELDQVRVNLAAQAAKAAAAEAKASADGGK